MKDRTPHSLPALLAANRNAMVVYAALRYLSGERRQLGTTRKKIRAVCGLNKDTITAAIKSLAEAHWLTLNYGRKDHRTWYRLSFPSKAFFPGGVCSGPSEKRKRRRNRPQGTRPWGRSNRPPSLKRRGPHTDGLQPPSVVDLEALIQHEREEFQQRRESRGKAQTTSDH